MSPAAIREFLLQSAGQDSWTPEYLAKALGLSPTAARDVLATLQAFGYVEPSPGKSSAWRNTPAGNAVAGVSKAKPISRPTLQKDLDEFVNRIYRVNGDPNFLYRVDKAVVFGPFLNIELERLRHVDIAVEIARKEVDLARHEMLARKRAEQAAAAGKQFPTFAARKHYAEDEVRKFLKGRGRAIALHEFDERMIRGPHRVIYRRES